MFRVGPWELLIILAIVLLIFGPRKLPDIARSIGKSIKEFRSGMKEANEAARDGEKETKS